MKINSQSWQSVGELTEFIAECEASFEAQLDAACSRAVSDPGISCVLLSGPSCSGKTTTAKKLISVFESSGRRAHTVSIDDFYKNREDTVMKRTASGEMKPDYETIDSIDLDAFLSFCDGLSSDSPVRVPVFDFNTGKREGYRTLLRKQGDIVLFEGIQAIYPEITRALSGLCPLRIHISVGDSLSVGGVVFLPEEIRLMRRLVRDSRYRSAPPELTFYLWDEVRDNEVRNIEPYINGCDIVIDSLLAYEVGVLAPYLRCLLRLLPEGSAYADKAKRIEASLANIRDIPLSAVPKGSVFREFLH